MVGIIIVNGRAYIPSLAETSSGLLIQVDPIVEHEIDQDALVRSITNAINSPHSLVPDLSRDEWKKRKDPVLKATRMKSWKELAKKGLAIGLEWTEQGIKLDIPRVNKIGQWEVDPTSVKMFSLEASVSEIVDFIVKNTNIMRYRQ